ncbi:hypothetical protein AB1Y20_002497 [Prymnesium parvum]|uniref:WD40 repeat-containing protein SMU1 n=1 Tax=Prymnesium parvum TaxID=97485 RepID=A0AB34JC03_PRYPA|mmetsp:Transcript_1835/g.4621  ORF Transcript_1835/g.4621 Transcript_1835/m.4621 type:complete len:549 (-) Transcript_1835:466-2112(-)
MGKAKTVRESSTIDPTDPNIKEDILRMILQYLQNDGYSASFLTLQDEANVKLAEQQGQRSQLKRARKAIFEGDWAEVEKVFRRWAEDVSKISPSQQKSFLYSIHREQYLELIEGQEYQKAFTHLTKRLKPLEASAASEAEFRDLCYLLTCKSVQEVLRDWEGVAAAREKLAQQLSDVFDEREPQLHTGLQLPQNRLLSLLQQAVAYQIEFSHYQPKSGKLQVASLMKDYSCPVLPNATHAVMVGHTAGVKCVAWLADGMLASGCNDGTLRLWNTNRRVCTKVLEGHKGRIWDVCASASAEHLASASADGHVRVWRAAADDADEVAVAQAVLAGHSGDVYSVRMHPTEHAVLTCGYDKTVRLFDVNKGILLRTMQGHELSVRQAVFNATGNLIVSGGKDATIRFWDARSGLCVKRFDRHLGEVTSVQLSSSGALLLSSSTDNAIRLWDVRMARPLRSFKGHMNTSKCFIRAQFWPGQDLVISGSEDSSVCLWDSESGHMVQRLRGHTDVVYNAVWNEGQGMLASCSHDGTVRTWWYDEALPLVCEQHTL